MGCCMASSHVGSASSSEKKNDSAAKSSGIMDEKRYIPSTPFPEISKRRSKQHLTQNVVIGNEDKDIREFYDIDNLPVLGSGISGSVKICIHKTTKIKYALKTLSKRKLQPNKISKLKKEMQIMADLDHPNILRLQEYFETRENIFLILELCRGGELLDRLQMQKGHHYSEKLACHYIHTMLSAVAYCHAHKIVHRDLKLENFLFESEAQDSELKLIDFGLSQYFNPEEVLHRFQTLKLQILPYFNKVLEGNYDAKCDVWSIGVIAYMLLSGTPPFYGKTDAETLRNVKVGRWKFEETLFKPVSAEGRHFITSCLTRRVVKRPSAKEALSHEWFRSLKVQKEGEESSKQQTGLSANVVERLHLFVRSSSLVKICMEVIAHTLLPEQISDLRREFMRIDTSDRGEITYADLRRTLEQHGSFSEKDLNFIFEGVNFDHTGTISYHEFLAATISKREITEENLRVAFDKMSNHNLYIAAEDIVDLLGADSSEEEIVKILEENNLKPSSQIFFSEFKQIMNGGCSTPMVHSPYRAHRKKIVFWTDDGQKEGTSSYEAATVSDSRAALLDNSSDATTSGEYAADSGVLRQPPPAVACPPSLRPPMLIALQESNPYLLSVSHVQVSGEGMNSNPPRESDLLLERAT